MATTHDPAGPEAIPPTSNELEERFHDLETNLEQRIRDVELEVASRRSYEKVVIVLGYAVIAAGILLGIVGYRNMSDIAANIDDRIDLRISAHVQKREDTLEKLKKNVKEAEDLQTRLTDAENRWKELKPALDNLARYDPDLDLKGLYLEMNAGDRNDPEWRAKATDIVTRIVDHVEDTEATVSSFDPSDIFNVAQVSRELNRNDLEYKLINAAYNARKTSSTRALYLQWQARLNADNEDQTAFERLMVMVTNVTLENPQIVISEAWNAAEALRRYTRLIDAIDELIQRHRADEKVFLPSFAIMIKARAHQRRGLMGDLEASVEAYASAVRRLRSEGLATQWGQSMPEDLLSSMRPLLLSGVNTETLDEAIDTSGIPVLQQKYERLRLVLREVNRLDLKELLRSVPRTPEG